MFFDGQVTHPKLLHLAVQHMMFKMSTKNNAIECGSLCEKSQYYLFDMFFNRILYLQIQKQFLYHNNYFVVIQTDTCKT